MALVAPAAAVAVGVLPRGGGAAVDLDLLIRGVEATVALTLDAGLIEVQRFLRKQNRQEGAGLLWVNNSDM